MSVDLNHAFDLAAGPGAAAAVFAYAHAGINADAGSLLTTASVYDVPNLRSRRVWTDDAAAYPTGNFKRLDRNLYFERVIEGKRPFHSTTIEEIATVFFDWEKIRDLGMESNMNLPAIAGGEVIGSINLLNRKGHFTADRVAAVMAWQPVATLAFLLLMKDGETATFHPGGAPEGPAAMEG
jgi:GAF domain-containing protein